jgi:hypothetical protein
LIGGLFAKNNSRVNPSSGMDGSEISVLESEGSEYSELDSEMDESQMESGIESVMESQYDEVEVDEGGVVVETA